MPRSVPLTILAALLPFAAAIPGLAETPPEWSKAVARIGGDSGDLSTVEARGTAFLQVGEQESSVPYVARYRLPDRMRLDSGQMVLVVSGDAGEMRLGERGAPMGSGAVRGYLDELQRTFFSLLNAKGGATAAVVAEGQGDGCRWLRVTRGEATARVCVSAGGEILRQRHEGMHPLQQVRGEIGLRYGDYRDVEGRRIPHRWEMTFDGNPMGRFVFDTITFSPDFDESTFRVGPS